MSEFSIVGGKPLAGSLAVHGAKNSVLPILAATILGRGQSVIHNCPDLSDVTSSIRILQQLGCKAYKQGSTVVVDSSGMSSYEIPDSLMREMRSSVVFLGAILARCRKAVMSFPGGCELGARPIDLHLSGLRQLGTRIREEAGNLYCSVDSVRGAEIHLAFPSVGATENIMLLAAGGQGVTRISNAAREPEIEDLQSFLNAMGARIRGAGSSSIVIEGVAEFHPAEHAIIPDRIVASTLLAAAATAGGEVRLHRLNPDHISTVLAVLSEAGCEISTEPEAVTLRRTGPLRAVSSIRTMPYPGFATDAQAPLMAMAARAEGTTVFVENIFENRYRHVGELARMGANIKVEGRVAIVCGVPRLYGARVSSTDLRGGAALVVAALGAEGRSSVTQLGHIDRGYDKLESMLSLLGADVRRTD